MLHGIIYICPDCRRVVIFQPNDDGTIEGSNLICADDGYKMVPVLLSSILVDALLKGEVQQKCQE